MAATTVTLVSNTSSEFKVAVDVARGSLLVRDVIKDDPDTDEPIPLPAVGDRELALIVEYLRKNKEEPIKRIERPLKSARLVESGVPEWAEDFINKVKAEEMLDLAEAAGAMRIKMLEYLVCARIAAEVKRVGKAGLEACYTMKREWTPEDNRKLKQQNDWAWKNPDTPVVDEDYEEPVVEGGGEGSEGAAAAGAGVGAGTA